MRVTAEHVREAIFGNSSYASYDGARYYADGIRMQAVADKLNARAERTCHNADDNKAVWFICSECGSTKKLAHMGNYCSNCGAKVMSDET